MALTVKDLRQRLADLPDEWPVVLAKDAEGNRVSPLDHIEAGNVDATEGWEWGFLSAKDLEDETDLAALLMNAVCLCPQN